MDLNHLLSNCCFEILCIFLRLKGKPCSQTASEQGCPGGRGVGPQTPLAAPPDPQHLQWAAPSSPLGAFPVPSRLLRPGVQGPSDGEGDEGSLFLTLLVSVSKTLWSSLEVAQGAGVARRAPHCQPGVGRSLHRASSSKGSSQDSSLWGQPWGPVTPQY